MTLHQAWVSNSLKLTTSATKLLSISLSKAKDPDSPNWPSGNSIGCSRRTDAGMAFLESLVVWRVIQWGGSFCFIKGDLVNIFQSHLLLFRSFMFIAMLIWIQASPWAHSSLSHRWPATQRVQYKCCIETCVIKRAYHWQNPLVQGTSEKK